MGSTVQHEEIMDVLRAILTELQDNRDGPAVATGTMEALTHSNHSAWFDPWLVMETTTAEEIAKLFQGIEEGVEMPPGAEVYFRSTEPWNEIRQHA